MLSREIFKIIKSPVYYLFLFIPFLLTFFMSQGTSGYLESYLSSQGEVSTAVPVLVYSGKHLGADVQFAISELGLMLMMLANLSGLSLFEDRRLHIWDRIIDKNRFVFIKFISHFIFAIFMILISSLLYRFVYDIEFDIEVILVFLSISILGILFGISIGSLAKNRAVLSNVIMLVVMLMGYFGGALSLTSVLSNIKFMEYLMYLSPLTIANRVVFEDMLGFDSLRYAYIWIGEFSVLFILFISIILRRSKHDSII